MSAQPDDGSTKSGKRGWVTRGWGAGVKPSDFGDDVYWSLGASKDRDVRVSAMNWLLFDNCHGSNIVGYAVQCPHCRRQ